MESFSFQLYVVPEIPYQKVCKNPRSRHFEIYLSWRYCSAFLLKLCCFFNFQVYWRLEFKPRNDSLNHYPALNLVKLNGAINVRQTAGVNYRGVAWLKPNPPINLKINKPTGVFRKYARVYYPKISFWLLFFTSKNTSRGV